MQWPAPFVSACSHIPSLKGPRTQLGLEWCNFYLCLSLGQPARTRPPGLRLHNVWCQDCELSLQVTAWDQDHAVAK